MEPLVDCMTINHLQLVKRSNSLTGRIDRLGRTRGRRWDVSISGIVPRSRSCRVWNRDITATYRNLDRPRKTKTGKRT